MLFSFLEPSFIPEEVLHRGSSSQKRWGRDGEVVEICAEDEGVSEFLTKTIQGDIDFDLAVEKLLSYSLISCNKESNGFRNFSIHPLVQYCATQRLPPVEVNKWRWQAILLVCHAFQEIVTLNNCRFCALPNLSQTLKYYSQKRRSRQDDIASFRSSSF